MLDSHIDAGEPIDAFTGSGGYSRNAMYVVPWAEMTNSDRLTGSLAMKTLNSVQIRVKFPSVVDKEYEIRCYIIHNQLLQISSNSGRINKSINN